MFHWKENLKTALEVFAFDEIQKGQISDCAAGLEL